MRKVTEQLSIQRENYVGEFMHGKEHGQGTFSSSNFFYEIKSEHF